MTTIVDDVRAELFDAIEKGRIVLPTLPEVALRVREAAEDPDADVFKISEVLSTDAALSARVVKVANSPLLRAANPITDLGMAISRLGISYSCNLAVGLAMEQMFQATSDTVDKKMRQIWAQSTEIAGITSVLAKTFTKLNADQATLAGLIHKIGALPILSYAEANRGLTKQPELLDKLISNLHPEVGKMILETWDFTDDLACVPIEHLNFARSTDKVDYADVVMVAVLQASSREELELLEAPDWEEISAFERVGISTEVNAFEDEDLSDVMAESIACLQ